MLGLVDFCFAWCIMGDALFSKGVLLSWSRSFVGEKNDFEGCSIIRVLDHMEGEKKESLR